VSDPQSAIMDIYLGDLYYRFTKPLKPETVSQLHGFFVSGGASKQKAQSFVNSLKETAEKYFETAAWFINGADGKYEPWDQGSGTGDQGSGKDSKKSVKRQAAPAKKAQKTVNKEKLWEEFKGYVERLIGLSGYLNASGKTPAERLLKELASRIKERQLVAAAALGYGLLSVLRAIIGRADGSLAANLAFDHWDLDRKLKEQFRTFGANDDEVWRLGEICKAVLRRTGADNPDVISDTTINKKTAAFDAGRFAASIMVENHPREDFRTLIGVNVFNDVLWFNKEAFESALFYGKLFFVLETDSAYQHPSADRTARIAEVSQLMKKAEIDCGYQLDKFIQLLSGDEPLEPALGPQAKKPEAKKTPTVKKPTVSQPKKPTAETKKPEAKKTTAVKKPAPEAKKPEAKKTTAVKKPAPEAKKPEAKKTTAVKKPAAEVKKPEAKKTTTTKKPAPAAKKPAPAKKTTAVKKPTPKKPTKGKRNET